MKNSRILFVLKYRSSYGYSGSYLSSGLYWSARFVSDMLAESGFCTKLVQVVDNNDIDREVFNFKPDVVIIEALWVVPDKFEILKKLHPNVSWVVRLHSNIPFLATEGIAMNWIGEYLRRGVYVATNEERIFRDLQGVFFWSDSVLYLPNYYPVGETQDRFPPKHKISIGCYGAIRPLKNQLMQAVAAIRYANEKNKLLRFHINSGRVEGGDSVLKNLRALFKYSGHQLIEDSWMDHRSFLHHLRHVDIAMQVSLSETFSIASADAVSVGVPLVVSPEIKWASKLSKANSTDADSIVSALHRADKFSVLNVILNRRSLRKYGEESSKSWAHTLTNIVPL